MRCLGVKSDVVVIYLSFGRLGQIIYDGVLYNVSFKRQRVWNIRQ
jgi:hypothetical protein